MWVTLDAANLRRPEAKMLAPETRRPFRQGWNLVVLHLTVKLVMVSHGERGIFWA